MKGTIGKNKVDIMWPTAMDPSSINSIAMLIRLTLVIKKYNQTAEVNTASQPELAIQ